MLFATPDPRSWVGACSAWWQNTSALPELLGAFLSASCSLWSSPVRSCLGWQWAGSDSRGTEMWHGMLAPSTHQGHLHVPSQQHREEGTGQSKISWKKCPSSAWNLEEILNSQSSDSCIQCLQAQEGAAMLSQNLHLSQRVPLTFLEHSNWQILQEHNQINNKSSHSQGYLNLLLSFSIERCPGG